MRTPKHAPRRFSSIPHRLIAAAAVAVVIAGAPSSEAAEPKKRIDIAAAGRAAVDLGRCGRPFFQRFFRWGWPTTKAVRRDLILDAQGASTDTIIAIMSSGFGLPLGESTHVAESLSLARGKERQPWRRSSELLAAKHAAFAELAGYQGDIDVEPVLFEFSTGEPDFRRSYQADKLSTQTWSQTGANTSRLSLDAIAASLHAQARFARVQLLEDSRLDRRDVQPGHSPEDGFFALVALHNALAKVRELRERCVAASNGTIGTFQKLDQYEITQPRRWLPHRFNVKLSGRRSAFEADKAKESFESQLYDQVELLQGLCELMAVTSLGDAQLNPARDDPRAEGVAKLFQPYSFNGRRGTLFSKDSFREVAEVAIFVVFNLQRLHFDVTLKTFRGRSSKNPESEPVQALSMADAGLTLLGLEAFCRRCDEAVKRSKKKDAFINRLLRARGYAATMARFLARWIGERCKSGFYDRYNISSRSALGSRRSAISFGYIIRGLLALQRFGDKDIRASERQEALGLAARLAQSAEGLLFDPETRLYIGRGKSSGKSLKIEVAGQVAMIGALRDLAVNTRDLRYVIRLRGILEALKRAGFLAAETARGGERGGDSDRDGIPAPGEARCAPVILSEVAIKKAP